MFKWKSNNKKQNPWRGTKKTGINKKMYLMKSFHGTTKTLNSQSNFEKR